MNLPKCPQYVAHPQAVWFEEHWRPVFDSLRGQLIREQNAHTNSLVYIEKLKLEIEKLKLHVRGSHHE